jgi:hypothetical protein
MSTVKGLLNFDLRSIPFSRYSSYLAFSELGATETHPASLFLRTIHGDAAHRALSLCGRSGAISAHCVSFRSVG